MKASLYNYKQSPRKVRLVTNLVKGKTVPAALLELSFLPKRAALPIKKLIASALANAVAMGASTDGLIIKDIRVDKGLVMKRRMPRARGSAFPINKRTSHLIVVLGEKAVKGNKAVAKKEVKAEKAEKPKKAPAKKLSTKKKPTAKK